MTQNHSLTCSVPDTMSAWLDDLNHLVALSRPHVKSARWLTQSDPSVSDVWLDPASGLISLRTSCMNPYTIKQSGLDSPEVLSTNDSPAASWVPLAITSKTGSLWDRIHTEDSPVSSNPLKSFLTAQKSPYTIKSAATAPPTGYSTQPLKTAPKPGPSFTQILKGIGGWNDAIYPSSPLTAMLASGILGAGLGYGGASLASLAMPDDWDRRRFRQNGFLLGGAVGAAPGALETMRSLLIGQPVLNGRHMEKVPGGVNDKTASYGINTDNIIRTIWENPRVNGQMSRQEKTLATGSLSAARAIAGSPVVTPHDMARLTAGMGTGYASGLVAGRVLGALTGLPVSAQNRLAQGGMYAGTVKAVLPMIFGAGR